MRTIVNGTVINYFFLIMILIQLSNSVCLILIILCCILLNCFLAFAGIPSETEESSILVACQQFLVVVIAGCNTCTVNLAYLRHTKHKIFPSK